MKLSKKNTILIGLAFLTIQAFEQMYNSVMPLILTNSMGMSQQITGAIMGVDNILALFLMPLFGILSDRTRTPIGRRMPFILVGSALAVVLMNLLPLLANQYFAAPSTWLLVLFCVVLGVLLVVICAYRSPAVALMPDITPKPLRSKGNALINLMGALGGIIYFALSMFLYSDANIQKYYTLSKGDVSIVDYRVLFAVLSGITVVAIAVLMLTVNENELSRKAMEYEKAHPEEDLSQEGSGETTVLPQAVKRSLLFLLSSVALWYMAYNAVTTWFSKFIETSMGVGIGGASTCLLVANVGAIVSYIPIGMLSSKIGRKKSILAGVGLLTATFAIAFFVFRVATAITPPMYFLFACVGVAWATISVNSLPMVVEMCKGGDVGRFTGYYYTFAMVAQVLTPVLSSLVLTYLFPYAAVFALLSGLTMLMVRHGDTKAASKKGLEAYAEMD